ncbi:hypothetical protein GF337_08720 [candidate division KSB1 bacterium]|nr:hypothetical protein [candidate division KSB1 bacterium]
MSAKLEEKFIQSKTGRSDECEDAIYTGEHYFAVIDGATTKDGRKWGKYTGGRVVSQLLRNKFTEIDPDFTPREAVDFLTDAVYNFYERDNYVTEAASDPRNRIVAVVAAFNAKRREIWSVGDCHCRIGNWSMRRERRSDVICANFRSMLLELEILKGKTLNELREHDTGREYILPLLREHVLFNNNMHAGNYCGPVIDGFLVPDECIDVYKIDAEDEFVILASDGYPVLKQTLRESEQELKRIIEEDPLLFRKHKELKCVLKGNVSFDDRSFLKISLKC